MLVVFGSASLDTIRTPRRTLRGVLGGAAVFAAISSSNFARTGLIAVTGRDFPSRHIRMMSERMDLAGLEVADGRTFRYDGRYSRNLETRTTVKVELNVLGTFRPKVPESYRGARFVYLANNDPDQNLRIIGKFDRVRFSMCDTIDYWIKNKRRSVTRLMGAVDAAVINDEEARLLTGEHNLQGCARRIMKWGPKYVVIKKAEHGSILFHGDEAYPAPGVMLDRVVDPTGAGDSFAGAMMGYMAGRGSTSLATMRRAAAYGNVMGSFAVEGYGLDGLLRIRRRDADARFRRYARACRF
ncbi:MAG: PfkB family carbohydrate kinase [Nitrosopumilus sp.]|nr:PfkB family carbohydrate kinase [Nitrosopumilus sp.]MDA7942467.1 PfkB family carbohydrate kinase [Nitrosopumilus sp.]MDA7953516.1 PfkB family carbohydrate kinase [Nitrosopumilus sp.]MDA7958832.1 PfkB family carbohydrate kinase [Nitrosopumilus sp.]MDA7960245.1 PfkB family carbohydrate kinase [Nitrosopumilus sp.]